MPKSATKTSNVVTERKKCETSTLRHGSKQYLVVGGGGGFERNVHDSVPAVRNGHSKSSFKPSIGSWNCHKTKYNSQFTID